MSQSVKCALFDLDGTLVSTGGAGAEALDRAIEQLYGIANAMRAIDPQGKTDPRIIREIFAQNLKRDCGPNELFAVQKLYLEFLREECANADKYQVLNGVRELLEQLQNKNVLLGLGTGNIEAGARIKLERADLNTYFPFGGYGSDSEERSELLRIGAEKAEKHGQVNLRPDNIFVIGDTHRDILAAKKAGFKVIALASGNSTVRELEPYNPDHLFADCANVNALLRIICG